jgi:Putative papain-like cysteine peptidase (DUF1796)
MFARAISVGSFCGTAYVLKHTGLRDGAYPWDQVFSSPETVCMALECPDKFWETVMDSTQTIARTVASPLVHKFVLHHIQGDQMNADENASMARRIDRWNAALRAPTPSLFVCVTYCGVYDKPSPHEPPAAAMRDKMTRLVDLLHVWNAAHALLWIERVAATTPHDPLQIEWVSRDCSTVARASLGCACVGLVSTERDTCSHACHTGYVFNSRASRC